jgi:hypothetical protein
MRRRRARPGRLDVRVLDPVSTEGLQSRDLPELAARVRAAMQSAIDELRAAR